MKNFKSVLLIITILAFLLPFLPPSCSGHKSKEEATVNDIPTIDTLNNEIKENYSKPDSSAIKLDTLENVTTTEEKAASLLERVFLYPDNKNLSGFGYIFSLFEKEYFCIFFSFLFLWVVLINHLINIKIFVFSNFSILLTGFGLLIILGIYDYAELKYGYWIITGLYIIVVATFYISEKQKS